MAKDSAIYMGPRLKRLRRDLGLTQAHMASDLDISPSYVALMERNQRPLTADLLLKLARTYKLDLTDIAGDGGAEYAARLQTVLKDPMFADIDLPPLDAADVAASYPGITEAFLRLHASFREGQLALADRVAEQGMGDGDPAVADPIAEARRFLSARKNSFPLLDDRAEQLAQAVVGAEGIVALLGDKYGLRVRRMPAEVMMGALRRHDRHREEVQISEALDMPARTFQLALQLVHFEMQRDIDHVLRDNPPASRSGERLARRALANYAAAAWMMPYAAFARATEARGYDVEALARQFGVSFEQAAHRLTTLQKPGQEGVPFFFLRIDPAGNVSKRLDGAGFPFARHGGACPLWNVHSVFQTPGQVVTQWLELPDGQRFFSIARTVTAGGGAFGAPRILRAVALACAAEHAGRLVYTRHDAGASPPVATPIGIACRLCHRPECLARSAPPTGHDIRTDAYRESGVPFGLLG